MGGTLLLLGQLDSTITRQGHAMARNPSSKKRSEAASEAVAAQAIGLEARLLLKEQAIRDEVARIHALEIQVARERLLRVQDWLRANRSDIARVGPMQSRLIADGDSLSLAELEGYGTAGNAVRVTMDGLGDVGDLWWCDPEGRQPVMQRFAFYTNVNGSYATFSLQYMAEPLPTKAN
jgi:hypothetical protein